MIPNKNNKHQILNPPEGMMAIHKLVLLEMDVLKYELPTEMNKAIIALFPTFYGLLNPLTERLKIHETGKGLKLTETELLTLYVCHELIKRTLNSKYASQLLNAFQKKQQLGPEQEEKLGNFMKAQTANFLKETAQFAKKSGTLKLLADVKRRLAQLPDME